ncbi:DUF6011 domain-containing protein [Marmoricola sp. URHA0025 HA25]
MGEGTVLQDWEAARVLREAIRELRNKSIPEERGLAESRIATNSGIPLRAVGQVLDNHPDKFRITDATAAAFVGAKKRPYGWPTRFVIELTPAFREHLLAEERETKASTLTGLWAKVRRELDRKSVDAVVLRVPHRDDEERDLFRARLDFVEDAGQVELWVTCDTKSPDTWMRLMDGAHCLSRGGKLPLRPAAAKRAAVVPLLVRRFATIDNGVWHTREVFIDVLRIPEDRIVAHANRAEYHAGATREAIEYKAKKIGSRAYRPGGTRRFAVTYCDRCGQPLSDPTSVAYGVGPECRRYYGIEVLEAVRRWKPGMIRVTGRKLAEWVAIATSESWEHRGPPL